MADPPPGVKFEDVVRPAVGEQPGIEGDLGGVKLKLDPLAECGPEGWLLSFPAVAYKRRAGQV